MGSRDKKIHLCFLYVKKLSKGNYTQFEHKDNVYIYCMVLQNKSNNKDFAEYPVLRNLEKISQTQKRFYFDNIIFEMILIENLTNN